MKKSSIIKIWGVVMTAVVLAGLLVAQAIPASAATLVWTQQTIPSVIPFNILTANTGTGANAWVMDVAPDGKTIFAYNNVNTNGVTPMLYKSTNGGATFTASGLGSGLNGQTVVALNVSSNYASDSLVVAATASTVYASTNGGASFGSSYTVGTGDTITSIDSGLSYNGGIAIIVGWSSTTPGDAGAALFGSGGLGGSWTPLTFPEANLVTVAGVALSPTYSTDATVMMVSANSSGIWLDNKVGAANTQTGNLAVDGYYSAASLPATGETINSGDVTHASLAFPADFSLGGSNSVFVGLGDANATATNPISYTPVKRVAIAPTSSASTMTGFPTSSSPGASMGVQSLSFKGNLADGYLYAGMMAEADSNPIWAATGTISSSATFTPCLKSPAGGNVTVVASPASGDSNIFAITSNNLNSALYVSSDNAANFNQISLINISNQSNMSVSSFVAVDSNTMFMVMNDSNGTSRFFETTNGGLGWMATLWNAPGLEKIYLSPSYATDSALYVTTSSTVYKSTNSGMNFFSQFLGVTSIGAFAPVDANTFYYSSGSSIYKSGVVSTPAVVTGGTVTVIDYVDASNMFVGTDLGFVYISTNGGSSFIPLGVTKFSSSIADIKADVNYATNSTVYATDGTYIKSFVVGTSTDWGNSSTVTGVTELAQGTDGTMYAAVNTLGTAPLRSVSPGLTAIPGNGYYAMTGLTGMPGGNAGAISVIATGTTQAPNNTIFAAFGNTVYTVQDTLVTAPAITAPAAQSSESEPVTVSWTPIAVPAGVAPFTYQVTMATDPGFNNTVSLPEGGHLGVNGSGVAGETTGSSILIPAGTLNPGSTYYWNVKVVSPLYSKAAPPSSFSVKLSSLPTGTLTLNAPTAGETDVPLKPSFEWSGVNGATGYNFQVSDNPVFVNPIEDQTNLNTTVWTLTKTLDYNTVYYWRVQAINSNSNVTGDWVQGSFTTLAQPVATTSTTVAPLPTQTTTVTVTPPITLTVPQTTPTTPATPSYIWVIIAIGAVLVIAVIVLIARTRRV